MIERNRDILRKQQSSEEKFPILLNKVLFSGTHTGDYLTVKNVKKLSEELVKLKALTPALEIKDRSCLTLLINKLAKLAKVATLLDKPIVF